MSVRLLLLLNISLVVLQMIGSSPLHAAAVYLKDRDEPIVGFLVKNDARQVVIDEVQRDGTHQRRSFDRRDIDELVVTVSPERLGSLDRTKPATYRAYAEELAEQRRDPEARAMAVRLFLISAYLDPDLHGRSSLLGLIDLAQDKEEERKFRAMAYLLDPAHDPRTLRPPEQIRPAPQIVDPASRDLLVIALQLLRQGKRTEARRAIDRSGVKEQLDQFQEVISYEQFTAACALERLPTALLTKILQLELTLRPQSASGTQLLKDDDKVSSWRDAVRRNGRHPVPTLSLETMTKFNPRRSQFRDGKWIEPGGP